MLRFAQNQGLFHLLITFAAEWRLLEFREEGWWHGWRWLVVLVGLGGDLLLRVVRCTLLLHLKYKPPLRTLLIKLDSHGCKYLFDLILLDSVHWKVRTESLLDRLHVFVVVVAVSFILGAPLLDNWFNHGSLEFYGVTLIYIINTPAITVVTLLLRDLRFQ